MSTKPFHKHLDMEVKPLSHTVKDALRRNRILGEIKTTKLDLELALTIDSPGCAVAVAQDWQRLSAELDGRNPGALPSENPAPRQPAAIPSLSTTPSIVAPIPKRNLRAKLDLLEPLKIPGKDLAFSPPLPEEGKNRIPRPATPWPRVAQPLTPGVVHYYFNDSDDGASPTPPAAATSLPPCNSPESEESSSPVSALIGNARVLRSLAVAGNGRTAPGRAHERRRPGSSNPLPPRGPSSNPSGYPVLQGSPSSLEAALLSPLRPASAPRSSYSGFWRQHDISLSSHGRGKGSDFGIALTPYGSLASSESSSWVSWPDIPFCRPCSRSCSCPSRPLLEGSLSSHDGSSDWSSSSSGSWSTPSPAPCSPCSVVGNFRNFDAALQFRWDVFNGPGDEKGEEEEGGVTCPYSTLCECRGDVQICLVKAL